MKSYYDIIVVGAGPAGSMAAKHAAEAGTSVLILEKDPEVGLPVRCGEAVSKMDVERLVAITDEMVSARISKLTFVSPDNTEAKVDIGDAGYVLDRTVFDRRLADLAVAAGSELVTSAYVNGLILEERQVRGVRFEHHGLSHSLRCGIVIAADGVESRVGRWAGLDTHIATKDMDSAVQISATNITIEPDNLRFYVGTEIAPSGYIWAFPKGGDRANIGIAISSVEGKKRSAESYFASFLKRNFPDAVILQKIAGGVPCAPTLKKISGKGIMLAGDAARQVNPLSGAGIVTGMIGGSMAGEMAAKAVKTGNVENLSAYDKAWRERVGKRHDIYYNIRKSVYKKSDEGFNKLAKRVCKIDSEHRTLGKVFFNALLDEPLLLLDVAKVLVI